MYVIYPTEGDPTQTGVGPVAQGKWPVVVFAHANNDRVCDINEKYLSLHDHWASWGFIVVAVDGTFTNCNRGSTENIELRSEGQISSLEVLEELANDPESRFYGRVDLDRIVMAGHSRGGGASLVSLQNDSRVRAVIDLQGVDMTSFGFGSDPLPSVPVLGITAGEDVDLNYPIVEPTEDQLSGIYTWVNINGGIHAYTADTAPIEPDDVPLISQQEQHDITEYFTTAFLARFVGVGDGSSQTPFVADMRADAVLFSHYGAQRVDSELSPLGVYVRWNLRMASGLIIDDFDGPQTGSDLELNALGGQNTFEGFETAEEVETYSEASGGRRPQVYRKVMSLFLRAGPTGTGVFRSSLSTQQGRPVAVGRGDSLQARVKGPESGELGMLEVRIETGEGVSSFPADDFWGPEPLSNRFSQLSIALDDVFGPEEVPEIISVAFHLSSGSIYLDDLRID
jgi:dienelactone hydrolase